ncbi:hypothetical protein HRbin12_01627 [bacterium HR12]|nr:hypothetical protein HRbin12_01627 [bacterium HR12]
MIPEVVWRDGAWCSGCQQPSRVLILDPERMLEAARNGGWSARYGSVAEREHLRQAVYRVARSRGIEVVTRSEGGRVGVLHVRVAPRPRPAARRVEPQSASRVPHRPYDDSGDLEAVRDLLRHVRAAAVRLAAEMAGRGAA